MEIRVLGPVEACRDGVTIPLSGRKPRTVLAMLAVNVGRVVSADQLAEALWGPALPANERAVLQTYISVLRRALGDRGGNREPIVRHGNGYQLAPDSARVDFQVFADHATVGRKALADSNFADASHQLDAALSLWRGSPVSTAAGPNWNAAG